MEHNSESFIVVKEFTDNGKNTREVIAKGVTKQGFIDAYTEKGCVMRGGENPHFEDIYSGVVYKLENHFEQGGRLNTYEDLSKEMPSVINENTTCIPIVDLALENSPAIGSNFEGKITSSNDVVDAVNYILERTSGLENKDLVVTLLLSQNNKVNGHLFSYRSNPIEKNADKQDFFRQIVSTLPAGIISVVVGNTEKSNTNEWNYFSNGISKELSFFEIRNLDTLFYDYFGSKNSVSFADSGKMRSGGLVANSYPDLSKEMPSFVSEIDKDLSQNNKISVVKKDKFCGEIPNKIERSFQAAKLFYSAWNKQKIGAVEEMFVLLLTATGRIISLYKHSLGARAGTILDNTIVSAVAVQSKAKGVIVCHNHPSGNLQPSQADIKVTQNLKEALFLCGINLVDSIIITPNENSYTSIFEEGLIMKNGGEIIYENGGQVNRERDIEIAKTILMQLGGSNRLQMFTGAYNFVAEPYGVSFRIKNRSVNYVKIVLNAMDTYDIEFGRISGVNYKIVKELSGIYNDQLVEIFTRYTGMVLRLKEGGAIQGEENAEMVMNQNLQIRHHTEELEEILKSGKEVPAWVVSKISRAADSMSDATHYLEGTPDKMAKGGNTRILYGSKLKTYVVFYFPVYSQQPQKVKRKVVYAESEKDAISQFPKKTFIIAIKDASSGYSGTSQRIEELEALVKAQNRRRPSLSQQIRKEIKALKEMLPLLEGKDKKVVQDEIKNLNDTLDEMRAEGQYADGGGVYDSADGISPAIQKAFNSLQNEGYFEKEAIEYVGGIKEWNKLSAREKEVIISDIEKDWSKSTFFAEGGGVNKMAMGGNTKRGRQSLSQKIRNEIKALEEMLPLLEGKDKKQVQDEIKKLNGYLDELDIIKSERNYADGGGVGGSTITNLVDFNPETTLVFDGDANFKNYPEITDLGNLQKITGIANFRDSQVQDLGNLQTIGGKADFEISKVQSLGNLQTIEGDAYFGYSQVQDLGNLQTIGGRANFQSSQVQDLGNLQTIKGGANFTNSQVKNLGNLQTIGGNVDFRGSQVQDLGKLKTINGSADFRKSQVEDLGNLQTIGGYANFEDSKVQSLGNLQTIGGIANFSGSQFQSLGNLQTIGRSASFRGSQIQDLGNLQTIGENAVFANSQIKNLGNLQTIGGTAYFQNSQVQNLGNLQTIEGDAYFGYSQVKDLGNLKTIRFGAYFMDSQVQDLGNLQTIGGDVDFENSKVITLGNLQTIGGDAYFSNSKVQDLGNLETIDGDADFRNRTDLKAEWEARQQPMPNPEPDFNIEQIKEEIEALKELLPFLEGDDKKEIEEQIDILNIALMQNENFGGGAEKEEIKQWYRINYPDDDLGNELNDAVTFEDLWNGLHNGSDVYEIIGVADSIIRERLFEHLAEIYGVDYDYVYKKWLDSDEPDAPNADENLSQKYYIDILNHKKGFKQERIYFNSYEEAKDWAIKNLERFDPDMIRIQMAKGGGLGKSKSYSEIKTPYGTQFSKTGGYKFVLVSKKGVNLNVWSNSKKKLEKQIDFLEKIGWNRETLEILETEKVFYANGGGVGKDILDKKFWKDIAHLWRTRHIDIDKNGDWYNTEEYKGGVNNTSGLYFTNESANLIVGLANSYNVTLLDVKNNNPNYTAFDYDKKRLEEFRNKEYAKGGEIFVCPVGTQIQTLIFDKSMFNLRQAKAWAKKNNFENDFVEGKLNTLRIRQKDPAMFTEDGFRTIQLRQGVQAVIGCPKKRTIRRKK